MTTDDKKMMAAFAMHALISRTPVSVTVAGVADKIAKQAWELADLMGQEADKRKTKEKRP